MSAQIIEFPMHRVRSAQPAVRKSVSARQPVPSVRKSVVIARAVIGWTLVLSAAFMVLIGQVSQGQSALATSSQSSLGEKTKFDYVTVRSGENLWALAEKYAPTKDPRDFIADIVALNNLDDTVLAAGMRLALPVN